MRRAATVGLMVLALVGCQQPLSEVTGKVAAEGPDLGQWHTTPDGCSRDPFDGRTDASTTSVITFVWEDPAVRHALLGSWRDSPDAPLRLEMSRVDGALVADLHTRKVKGQLLQASDCTTLALDTTTAAPLERDGRPTVAGRLQLDCRVKSSHVAADLRFDRCGY